MHKNCPLQTHKSYLFCDSWYICDKIMDVFLAKGFYTVSTLKTNRILYPYGTRMSVQDFAQKLKETQCKELFHIVAVKSRQYYVYRYEENLNGVEMHKYY